MVGEGGPHGLHHVHFGAYLERQKVSARAQHVVLLLQLLGEDVVLQIRRIPSKEAVPVLDVTRLRRRNPLPNHVLRGLLHSGRHMPLVALPQVLAQLLRGERKPVRQAVQAVALVEEHFAEARALPRGGAGGVTVVEAVVVVEMVRPIDGVLRRLRRLHFSPIRAVQGGGQVERVQIRDHSVPQSFEVYILPVKIHHLPYHAHAERCVAILAVSAYKRYVQFVQVHELQDARDFRQVGVFQRRHVELLRQRHQSLRNPLRLFL
mmetsp:Transcript_19268/g.54072  ORF Transcript_19268/g.54072 Transcript_19268/m.54072 type:complete len:263 (+) Transcript_19268:2740-3528(+)